MNRKNILWNIVTFILVFSIVSTIGSIVRGKNVERINYVDFLEMVENKEVSTVFINYNKSDFDFTTNKNKHFKTDNPKKEDFKEFLLLKEIKVVENQGGNLFGTIINLFFLLMGLGMFGMTFVLLMKVFRQGEGRHGTIVNDKKSSVEAKEIRTTFDDLQGCNEVKKDMQFVVDFLKNPKKYHKMGARMPKGIVLYGPPGTGKTLTAKAIAGTAGVPFFSVSASDFMEMYVGVGAKRVRELYRIARENAPCIVFIDEIDAVGKKRSSDSNGERDQTINALLTELDGFSGTEGIITICATNRLELLDEALIRPGRFDKHVAVPLPEKEDRLEILKLHATNKKLSDQVSLEEIASMTVGFSGADLEALLNESAFIAVNQGNEAITQDDIDRAFYRIIMKGDRKENLTSRDKEELELVAWHEAGHALATKLLTDDEVPKVTIIPSTSGAGGVTFRTPKKSGILSKGYLRNLIKIMYSGRVAEQILLGDDDKITTGASNDINKASELIKKYLTTYGMGNKFGMFNVNVLDGYLATNQEKIAEEASKIAKEMYDEAFEVLNRNKDLLKNIADKLIEKETLTNEELDRIINPTFITEELLELDDVLDEVEDTEKVSI